MKNVHPTPSSGKKWHYDPVNDGYKTTNYESKKGICKQCGMYCDTTKHRLGDVFNSAGHSYSSTELSQAVSPGDSTVNVDSTSGFASSGTAIIHDQNGGKNEPFTYTGTTSTTFTGADGITESFSVDDVVLSDLKDSGGCPLCNSRNWR